jgi:hypothetical protein
MQNTARKKQVLQEDVNSNCPSADFLQAHSFEPMVGLSNKRATQNIQICKSLEISIL